MISARSPSWLNHALHPGLEYMDLIFIDHGIFRAIYPNRHKLSDQAWRSSQPSPSDIRYLARRGVKTIVNLRGDRDCGSYRLEQIACRKHGIELVDFSVKSRAAPSSQEIREAKTLFETLDYPILMHCKSGADRVGLMSVLYMIFREGVPVIEAKRQLSLKYGHFRQADTGILDSVFDSYLDHHSREPIEFLDWIDNHYDPKAITQQFRADGWTNVLVNRVMRRE